MKHNRIAYALALAVAGTVLVTGCKKKEEAAPAPAPVAIEPAPAVVEAPAISFISLSVGNAAAEDKSVAAVAAFTPADPIIVSVRTDGTSSNATVAANLTYQDGQSVGPEQTQSISTDGPETTNFTFTNANPWPAGKYTATVTLNGNPAGTQEVEVK